MKRTGIRRFAALSAGWGIVASSQLLAIPPDLTKEQIVEARAKFSGATYLDASKPVEERVKDLVSRMTLDEKIAYLGGTGFKDKKVIGETQPLPRLGIPKFKMTDATLGSKLTKDATLFPSYISLAASFNPDLSAQYGQAVAEQCRADGYRILLGPGINVYRVPYCGRNFEYLGEDPHLISRLVVPYIQAVQKAGVIATVKHLVANNSEYFRKRSNSVVDERTLHEIYYPAFKAAIHEGGARAVMTAYNLLNGEWAAEDRDLVTKLLRGEWEFNGLVMTDWWSVFNTDKLIRSGVDIEMPTAEVLAAHKVRKALDSQRITEDDIDDRVSCILRPCIEFGLLDESHADSSLRSKWAEHKAVAEQVAAEGLVLLKNQDNLLPLNRDEIKQIALYGPNAKNTSATGGGAAGFDPGKDFLHYEQALKKVAGPSIKVAYHGQVSHGSVKKADLAIVFLTTQEHEYMDRPFTFDADSLYRLRRVSQRHDKVLAVVSLGGGIEMASWIDDVEALIYAWYPGTYGTKALGKVLFGDINPSGKLPISLEKKVTDTHYHGNFLPGNVDLPRAFRGWNDNDHPIFDVHYREGVLTGYRWYDTKDIEPLFPFGFGLSYTTFEISKLTPASQALAKGQPLELTVQVTNTGDKAGAEVVQVYVQDLESSVVRPLRELKAFKKVWLDPRESRTVSVELDSQSFAFWNPETKDWKVESGQFKIYAGSSSRNLPEVTTITVE